MRAWRCALPFAVPALAQCTALATCPNRAPHSSVQAIALQEQLAAAAPPPPPPPPPPPYWPPSDEVGQRIAMLKEQQRQHSMNYVLGPQ